MLSDSLLAKDPLTQALPLLAGTPYSSAATAGWHDVLVRFNVIPAGKATLPVSAYQGDSLVLPGPFLCLTSVFFDREEGSS